MKISDLRYIYKLEVVYVPETRHDVRWISEGVKEPTVPPKALNNYGEVRQLSEVGEAREG